MEKSMKSDFIKAVRSFKAGVISIRSLVTELTPTILKIPAILGYCEKDIKHDFYAEIISRLEKIISLYKEIPGATFSTWFNHVLKMEFYGFIKKKNKKELEYAVYYENSILSEYNDPLEDELKGKVRNSDYDILTKKEKKILDLKYGLTLDSFENKESIKIIIEKLDKKKKLEDRITLIYLKILNLEKKNYQEIDPEIKNGIRSDIEKLRYKKRNLEKNYYRQILTPTNEWVGDKLNISKNTTATFLLKIKNKMQKAFAEYEYSGV